MKNKFVKIIILVSLIFSSIYAKDIIIEKNINMEQKEIEKIYKKYIDQTYPTKVKTYKKEQEEIREAKEREEREAWQEIKNSINHKKFQSYINEYPNSKYKSEAKKLLKKYSPIIHQGYEYKTVKSPYTEKLWLDRNLGAKRACLSYDDSSCYGDLFQWGRKADGHEKRNSSKTSSISRDSQPNHSKFIISSESQDWLSSKNVNMWDGVNAVNNPCPSGFKVPSKDELQEETKDIKNRQSAFSNFLKLPSAGFRYNVNAVVFSEGITGVVWSSIREDKKAWFLQVNDDAQWVNHYRAFGLSLRCLKDDKYEK